jgi:hypothetical protein
MSGLSDIAKQGLARLNQAPQYSTDKMPALKPFAPTPPSGMEKAGNWLAPGMTLGGLALDYFGNK